MAIEFPSDLRRPPTREEHYVLEDLPDRERMLFGALAYVFFPASLFYARWDPFVRFHVRQGIGMCLLWIAARIYARALLDIDPEIYMAGGALGYVIAAGLSCDGIRNALSLKFRGPRLVGGWMNRLLPLPKKLGEPGKKT